MDGAVQCGGGAAEWRHCPRVVFFKLG